MTRFSTLFILAMASVTVLTTSGCSTAVPVTARFPDPPGRLATEACPDLQKLKDGPVLSDISRTINVNYGTYYECAVKVDTWNNWYRDQKINFEKAGK